MMKVGFLKRILMGVLMLALATSPTATSFALSEYWLDMFAQNDILFYDPTGSDCYNGSSLGGNTVMSKVVHYLRGNNPTGFILSDNGIAGVLANFQAESAFNPFRFQDDSVDGPAYGIAQFDPKTKITDVLRSDSRTQMYFNGYYDIKYSKTNSDTGFPIESIPTEVLDAWLSVQLDFFFGASSEFENTKVGSYRNLGGDMGLDYIGSDLVVHEAMNMAQTASDAARIFVWIMERPADKEKASVHRGEKANEWLKYVESSSLGSTGGGYNQASNGSNVSIIGDAIVASSAEKIRERLPDVEIYAINGRQFYGDSGVSGGVATIRNLLSDNKLRDVVIYALGTEGEGFTIDQIEEIVGLVGETRKIIFMTNYTVFDEYLGNNNNIAKVKNEKKNVYVIDWKSLVSGAEAKYLQEDGMTPNANGQSLLAGLVASNVNASDSTVSVCFDGSVDGGLTNEQAQKIVDYYNSDEVDSRTLVLGLKMNCVSFSEFFVRNFTEYSAGWPLGHGVDVASRVASRGNLQTGTAPRPFALFSTSVFIKNCYDCGHTGIVIRVDGDKVTVLEAGYNAYMGRVNTRDISYFVNEKYGVVFTYLESILDQPKLAEILNR